MPGGREHLILWKRHKWAGLLAAAWMTAMSLPYAAPDNSYILLGPAVWGGYLLGYYIDPDLDQASTTSSEWRLMRHLKIIGTMIVAWFLPYGYIMKHRSTISHMPFLSTAIRFAWLLAFPPIAALLWLTTNELVPEYWPMLLGLLIGLSVADLIHYLADQGLLKA